MYNLSNVKNYVRKSIFERRAMMMQSPRLEVDRLEAQLKINAAQLEAARALCPQLKIW